MIAKIQNWIEGRVDFGESLKGVRTHYWLSAKIRAIVSSLFSCCTAPCDTIAYKDARGLCYLNKRSCVRWINQHGGSHGHVNLYCSDLCGIIDQIRQQSPPLANEASKLSGIKHEIPTNLPEDSTATTRVSDVSAFIQPSIQSENDAVGVPLQRFHLCEPPTRKSTDSSGVASAIISPFQQAMTQLHQEEKNPKIYLDIVNIFLKEPNFSEAKAAFNLWKRMVALDKTAKQISLKNRLECLEQIRDIEGDYGVARKYLGKTRHEWEVAEYLSFYANDPTEVDIDSTNGWALFQKALTLPAEEAQHYYEIAAEYGNLHAQFKLALSYEVEEKGDEAFKLFQEAAMEGYRPAQKKMSEHYHKGSKTQQDLTRSRAWAAIAKSSASYE